MLLVGFFTFRGSLIESRGVLEVVGRGLKREEDKFCCVGINGPREKRLDDMSDADLDGIGVFGKGHVDNGRGKGRRYGPAWEVAMEPLVKMAVSVAAEGG